MQNRIQIGRFGTVRVLMSRDDDCGVSNWPSGLVHRTQVLVLAECGFESRPGRSRRWCPSARHLTIIASSFGWDVKP